MKLKTGDWVVVADGSRGLVFVNDATAFAPELKTLRVYDQDNPRTHELGRDQPPRAFSPAGTRRSAMDAADLHQVREDRFVAHIVDELEQDAANRNFKNIVVVAPPAALGVFRKAANEELSRRVVAWIDQDLTKQPVPVIAAAIARVLEG